MAAIKEAAKPVTGNGPKVEKEGTPATVQPAPPPGEVNPFEFLRRFAEQMDHLFEDFGIGWRRPALLPRRRELFKSEGVLMPEMWSPRVEVKEEEGRFIVKAELPGLSKEEVKVEVDEGLLTIRGERKRETKKEEKGYHYSECSYGSFYRGIPIPEGVDVSKAVADLRNGELMITMPLQAKPEQKPHKIEVRSV